MPIGRATRAGGSTPGGRATSGGGSPPGGGGMSGGGSTPGGGVTPGGGGTQEREAPVCPRCLGTGEIRRTFLGLFSWTAPCPRCRNTAGADSSYNDWTTFAPDPVGDRTPAEAVSPTARTSPGWTPGGGASGGAGASGAWDEGSAPGGPGAADLPLIVDPFAGESAAPTRTSEAADAPSTAPAAADAPAAAESAPDAGSEESGTAY
jgi:hypothetical protein